MYRTDKRGMSKIEIGYGLYVEFLYGSTSEYTDSLV